MNKPFYKPRYRVQAADHPEVGHNYYLRSTALRALRSQAQWLQQRGSVYAAAGVTSESTHWELIDLATGEAIKSYKVHPPAPAGLTDAQARVLRF